MTNTHEMPQVETVEEFSSDLTPEQIQANIAKAQTNDLLERAFEDQQAGLRVNKAGVLEENPVEAEKQ